MSILMLQRWRTLLIVVAPVQGLRLLQAELSHERYLDETTAKVTALEQEVEMLRAQSQAKTVDKVEVPGTHGEATKRGWLW